MPKRKSRIHRESETVQAMIHLYCHAKHHTGKHLCHECQDLARYALARLRRCPYQELKPTCARCPIHCYRPDMRQRMREVMRYGGPRMLYRHPVLALGHLRDGLRKAPPSPATKTSPTPSTSKDEHNA
jgi:hypothetical protein